MVYVYVGVGADMNDMYVRAIVKPNRVLEAPQ